MILLGVLVPFAAGFSFGKEYYDPHTIHPHKWAGESIQFMEGVRLVEPGMPDAKLWDIRISTDANTVYIGTWRGK